MLKQKHYHIYMICLSLLLIVAGGLVACAVLLNWSVSAIIICVLVIVSLLVAIWQAASFLPNQVNFFLGSILSHDSMGRFPESSDPDMRKMYNDMNRIIQKYGQSEFELETKRMYYDRILRIMTHELRNSVTPIITLSEDMLKREYSREDSREAVEVINEQCTTIKQFLDRYYELTHLPKPEIKKVDAHVLLSHIERLYASTDPDSKISVSISCAQGLTLLCDEKLINQILVNLVKNAIEASATSINIVASNPDGHPRITVSDNGPGIPSGLQEDIFLPFYTSKSTGSGIGLSLSRQIMNLHKGSLTCSSNENGGAVFILQF